jgi:hypothetical protein
VTDDTRDERDEPQLPLDDEHDVEPEPNPEPPDERARENWAGGEHTAPEEEDR